MITSLGCEAVERASAIARQADIVAALTLEVLKGTTKAFDTGQHDSSFQLLFIQGWWVDWSRSLDKGVVGVSGRGEGENPSAYGIPNTTTTSSKLYLT